MSRMEIMRLEIEESFFIDAEMFFTDPMAERPSLTQLTPVKLHDIDIGLQVNELKMVNGGDIIEIEHGAQGQNKPSQAVAGFLLDSNSSIAYND